MDRDDQGVSLELLICDRHTRYVSGFDEDSRSESATIVKTTFPLPNAHASADRFVRTVRSESLDRVLVRWYERSLQPDAPSGCRW
jgi:putative transposase